MNVMAVGLLAGVSAACSDSGRFSSNPFTNPFAAAPTSQVDRTTTGTLPSRSAPVGQVSSQPLPPVANVARPSGLGSAQPVARVASPVLQNASPIGGAAAGWTAAGGTPVTVGAGDTANTLSARYGVPVAAINAANGGVIRPGTQAIIPVFRGDNAAQSRPGVMQPPAAAAPVAQAAPAAARVAAPVPPAPVAAAPRTQPAAVQLPPQRPMAAQSAQPTVRQAAKPAQPAKPAAPSADDDDDEDDTPPRRIVAAAPKAQAAPAAPVRTATAPTPASRASAPAAPAPRAAAPAVEQPKPQAQPRPQPRVIPMTPQETPRPVAEAPKPAEPVTTQSIPTAPRAAETPAEKAEFRWPARGRIISGFGSKGGNGDGIAIAVPEGTPVKAAEGGTVAYAGEELKGYGKLVLVRHDNGYVSAYAHNGELNVKRGDKVSRGQTIARSGSTGNVTSPQLHFELRKGSTPVDPTKYLEN